MKGTREITPREIRIREICASREIEELVHFTYVDNLESILRLGLMGRRDLANLQPPVCYRSNDPLQLDGYPNAVCLSISFPNYRMFYKYRTTYVANWVVISLHPSILWELDCAFYAHNAASYEMKSIPLSEHKKAEAFAALFSEYYNGGIKRADNIPPAYPTNPQAEVLVFERIPPTYIRKVYFETEIILDEWLQQYADKIKTTIISPSQFIVAEEYFAPRCDYKWWKKPVEAAVEFDSEDEIPF